MNIIETIISTVIGIILSVFAWIIKRLYAQVDNMEIKMRIAEMFIYTNSPTVNEDNALAAYLYNRYGIINNWSV